MRKTNKKLSKLVDDKSGVILVTVIFIVAMALVFITTALTISIANRQRVYSNATSDQARLTVTSLSQAIWQAIYSQQINDQMLYELAKGSTNNGSLVTFTSSDIPGMGNGSAVATAYFYLIQEEDRTTTPITPRKIGIECKCDIDGNVQYYTMVLQKNQGESTPPTMFQFVVNLGDGGYLNSCNIGMVASSITGNTYNNMQPHTADDNVVFLHKPTANTEDNLGFYSTILTDGYLYMQDSIVTRDVYFLGQDAGIRFGGSRQLTQHNPSSGTRRSGDLYFWGTRSPFVEYSGTPIDTNQINFNHGVNNVYFDTIDTVDDEGNHTYTGFENFNMMFEPQTENGINGTFIYDRQEIRNGIRTRNGGGTAAHWTSSIGSDWVEAAGMDDYLVTDPDIPDTINEIATSYATQIAEATDGDHNLNLGTATGLTAGNYFVTSSATITRTINCNVSGGDIIIVLDENVKLDFGANGYMKILTGGTNNLIFILKSGAQIRIGYGCQDNCGIVDVDCFSGSYFDARNLNQSKVPRCMIFSMYTISAQAQANPTNSGYQSAAAPVCMMGNGSNVLTAMLGFYPQSDPDGGGGCKLFLRNCVASYVFYGRISAGGIYTESGGNLNIPYCPTTPSSQDDRGYAYRDNTDYSVNVDECYYFTA